MRIPSTTSTNDNVARYNADVERVMSEVVTPQSVQSPVSDDILEWLESFASNDNQQKGE